MNTFSKRIISISLVGALVFHFFLVLVYCSPVKLESSKLNLISQKYVYPLFHQSWSLFVPTPKVQNEIYVRVNVKNESKKWRIVFPTIYSSKYKHVIFGNDAIALLFSNSLTYALNEMPNKSAVFNGPMNNLSFNILIKAVKKYIALEFKNSQCCTFDFLILSRNPSTTNSYLFKNISLQFE